MIVSCDFHGSKKVEGEGEEISICKQSSLQVFNKQSYSVKPLSCTTLRQLVGFKTTCHLRDKIRDCVLQVYANYTTTKERKQVKICSLQVELR